MLNIVENLSGLPMLKKIFATPKESFGRSRKDTKLFKLLFSLLESFVPLCLCVFVAISSYVALEDIK